MADLKKLALLREVLESAEASIRSAKQIIKDLGGNGKNEKVDSKYQEKADDLGTAQLDGEMRVVEGVFDGQNMIGPDKRSYPVPANYASKSKLVPGDLLKLTITENGSFVYKQIGPVPRRQVVGTLAYEDGQYKVLAEGNAYNVLLASVTYYKAEVGDQVTVVVPELEDSEWGAIENVLPPGSEGVETKQAELDIDIEE